MACVFHGKLIGLKHCGSGRNIHERAGGLEHLPLRSQRTQKHKLCGAVVGVWGRAQKPHDVPTTLECSLKRDTTGLCAMSVARTRC